MISRGRGLASGLPEFPGAARLKAWGLFLMIRLSRKVMMGSIRLLGGRKGAPSERVGSITPRRQGAKKQININ
jgi:hypothetical protein